MEHEYLHGRAFVKKSKGKIQIFETPYGLGDFVPVVAEGTTKPRMLKDRFADVVNVKDFGAVGDGVHDDTAAIQAAIDATGGRVVDLCGGVYKVTDFPSTARLTNGYIDFGGRITNVDGEYSSIIRSEIRQRFLCAPSAVNQEGEDNFQNSKSAPQGVACLAQKGVEFLFVSNRVAGTSLGYAYNKERITQYTFSETGEILYADAFSAPLSIGHGQGLGARIKNGQIQLFSMETGVPTRYDASRSNFGKGFTLINWKGSETTNSDCKSYRLFPLNEGSGSSAKPAGQNVRFLTPTLTPDGKTIILTNGSRVFGFDLETVLAITTPDSTGTGAESYEPIPIQIDATSVDPIFEFAIDNSTARAHQGIATDGRFIYISSGVGRIDSPHAVEVYSFNGRKVDTIWHSNSLTKYTENQINGLDPVLQCLTQWENEGVFVRRGQLCTISYVVFRQFGDIVSYKGANFACVTSNTGVVPTSQYSMYWRKTLASATKGEWSQTASYVGTGDMTLVDTSIFAIEPKAAGKADQKTLNEHASQTLWGTSLSGHIVRVPYGFGLSIKHIDSTNAEEVDFFDVSDGGISLKTVAGDFKISASPADRSFYEISNGNSARIRVSSPSDSSYPDSVNINSSKGTVLANFCSLGARLRLGSNLVDSAGLRFFGNPDLYQDLGGVTTSSTGIYISGIDRNVLLEKKVRSGSELVSEGGFGIYSGAVRPLTDGNISLGNASLRWSQIYAGTATISTSDERVKTSITYPDEALMRAWSKVNFRVFQFKDAVEKKGSDARLHVGMIAQQVIEAFKSEGLDATRYGLLCYDKWDDEYEDVEVVDEPEIVAEDGTVTPAKTHVEHRLVTPAGDRYGIRYEEALALEAAYQRWRMDKLEAALIEKEVKL